MGHPHCFECATATSALTLEADIRLRRANRRKGGHKATYAVQQEDINKSRLDPLNR